MRPPVLVAATPGGTPNAAKDKGCENGAPESKSGPDERLRKYGVLETGKRAATQLFEEYMKQPQSKPEVVASLKELLDSVKEQCQREATEQVKEEPKENKLEDAKRDCEPATKSPPCEHKNCEKILAEYLCGMARKVNEKFFTTLIIFARLYKDCMNECGWDIVGRYKKVGAEERKLPFTKLCDAEHVPEACNQFVNKFFLREFPNFEPTIAMDLTMHLCEWLYSKQYTHSKISQI